MPAVRIAAIIATVLLLDAFVLFVGRVVTMEANQREIMRALSAQSDTPGPEAQRSVDAAFAKAWSIQAWGLGFAACVALFNHLHRSCRGYPAVEATSRFEFPRRHPQHLTGRCS
jgi:hypothetical protein